MSHEQIADRLLASQSRVSLERIRKGTFDQHEGRRLQDAAATISRSPFIVDDAPSRNMTELAAIARRQHRTHKLAAIAVDYIGLVDPDNPRDPRQEQVAKVSRRLKSLARELHLPVIALSQLNRATEDNANKRPRLSNLRESGAIEQDADVVMFVHREGYYNRDAKPQADGEPAEIIVEKRRNGPTDTANVLWFRHLARFDNAAPDWQEWTG